MVASAALRIGVLALQGDVGPHCEALERLGALPSAVKSLDGLDQLDGLILPGGESTTIGLLLAKGGIGSAIAEHHRRRRLALFGTCAGLILLAKTIEETPDQPHLGLLDVTVRRNAFGRQRDSRETVVAAPLFGSEPLQVMFIRAPLVVRTGPNVEVLARWQDQAILVREGSILAATFHPELTDDERIHRYFLDRVVTRRAPSSGAPS